MKMNLKNFIKNLNEFALINFGLILVAAGIYIFKMPNRFATGGVSGLAIVFNKLFPYISVGLLMLIINIILLVVGLAIAGFNFGAKTIYCSIVLSGMVWLAGKLFPLSKPLTDDTMLELVFAILLPAIGSAIVFNQNASTGGTDIVAKILNVYTHVHIGKTLLMADFVITLMAAVTFGIKIGMYSILGLILKGFLIDLVIEGMNLSKQVVIISSKSKVIENFIIKELNRDATVYKAFGAYTRDEKEVVTTIVSRKQAVKLRMFTKGIDEKAFITISNTSEIIGKGFRNYEL